ncbi:MAG: hypothetical protein CL677_08930 [Bdellovibrionaceae bacterium]|nr:hypothetical protein [Pseudobdellovibrionaceae bacterium]|tara:strand:+ start:46694 stop:47281 length:588 start_codon:yes stop_codon:yes gene_type:complete
MTKAALLLSALLFAGPVMADICSYNSKSVAQRARNFLAYYPGKVYTFCKPCGDQVMKMVYFGLMEPEDYSHDTHDNRAIKFGKREAGDTTYWQVVLNPGFGDSEREIDLAYAYVKHPEKEGYMNLGAMFSCINAADWGENPETFNTSMALQDVDQPVYLYPGNFVDNGILGVADDVTDINFFDDFLIKYPDAAVF